MSEKLIRDGKVAVLYSPGYGAGWSTWNGHEAAHMFNPRLVKAVLGESGEKPIDVAEQEFPESYHGGVEQLEVEWIKEGQAFRINEYDGSESVDWLGSVDYLTA